MADVTTALSALRLAVYDFVAAVERSASGWTTAPLPGKWPSSQVAEHVARIMEESANVVAGAPSQFPTFPRFLRPLVRTFFFKRALKNNKFPKAKAIAAFDPASGPVDAAAARARLEGALAKFDHACRMRAASGQPVESTVFGPVSVQEYARFQELHTHHHSEQMAGRA